MGRFCYPIFREIFKKAGELMIMRMEGVEKRE
jgi:hypothetical protein